MAGSSGGLLFPVYASLARKHIYVKHLGIYDVNEAIYSPCRSGISLLSGAMPKKRARMDPAVQRAWEAFSSVSTRLSDTKKRAMWRLAVGAPARGNGLTERQMKRAQAEALEPLQVFQEVRPLDRNGQGVPVLCADVRKLLVHACEATISGRRPFCTQARRATC